ncbi:glycosyltransferase family 2 protein [Natronorubrum bangense]|uniref:Glycosyltransferase n=2 Tax=Natronorubrum bangense TaxID=61858 RepID=A0A4D6HQX2_9EURY|nr:glycosyltransferase [Natronorubrum bangense]ELY44001.1 family 2 glycosyl transferase [Natronorubrum bangense JCM 10635]QCC53034.1 glycosyltransferase [Natronorubrum bangense]QCC56273.1 glycosyltransferase [Natronorubrum bangense]
MDDPALSVVMPTYNAAEYLRSAIDSILAQTFSDFELVIVNDGSTDGTHSIIESYDDDRIQTVRLETNSGIPTARNRGIEKARGEYVACHDSDDRSHRTRFERQARYLDANKGVAAVGTGALLVDESGDRIARRRVAADPSLSDLVDVNHFVHGSMIVRRSALEEVGYYHEWFELAEDYELVLRLADRYDVRNIDEPLYEQQIRTDSAYGSSLEKIWLYDLLAVKKLKKPEDWLELKRIVDRDGVRAARQYLSREELTDYHRKVARERLRYGYPKEAQDHVRQAVSFSKPSPMLCVLYSLSFFPPTITKRTAKAYRRYFLNPRLRLANARVAARAAG